MGKRGLHIALLLSLSESIFAVASDDALSRVVENERMNVVPEIGVENPAMMKDRYAKTLTEIEAGWVFGYENQPKIMQEGDGENRMSAVVDAFVKNGKNDIWGNAGYSIGQRRNVAFNETSDYRMTTKEITAKADETIQLTVGSSTFTLKPETIEGQTTQALTMRIGSTSVSLTPNGLNLSCGGATVAMTPDSVKISAGRIDLN